MHKDEAFKGDYKDQKSLPLLEYLFAFLRVYDFTTIPSDIKNNIKINQNKLINSAVLGLVFEKLNGYKEGSFYTPSFITSYMCKQALEKIVIAKFNNTKGWDCQDLESLKFKIDKLTDSQDGYKEANEIFDSIRICDPSVGSGHFLVSALNELIFIKYRLNILCDENNQRLKDIILELHNDEILIRDSQNKIFNYSLPKHENIESHKIQKSLFQIKRKLIESCLFGVDINPNSCEITKLRLWIELLKYSYYKDIENKRLETLPNIDINIKCGNSLMSRFDTKDSLKHIPNIKHQIDIYKKLVNDYKNADQNIPNISKYDLDSQIKRIKESFTLTLKDPKTRSQLQEAIKKHIALYGSYLLDDQSLLDGLEDIHHNLFGTPSLSAEEEESALDSYSYIQKLRKKLDLALKGEGYQDAFEWRFEFPEVLDSNGDFMGFDCVIGNPPYGVDLTKAQRETYKSVYKIKSTDTAQLFILKADKLLTPEGINSLIVPKALSFASNWVEIRDFIKPTLFLLADCGKAWKEKVDLEMMIFARQRGVQYETYKSLFLNDSDQDTESTETPVIDVDKKFIDFFELFPNDLSEQELQIGVKIKESCPLLESCCKNSRGTAYQKYLQKSGNYPFIGGKEIDRYGVKSYKGWYDDVSQIPNNAVVKSNALLVQNIIAHIKMPTPHIKITATIPPKHEVFLLDTLNQLVFDGLDAKLMWGLLNSKFLNWYIYRFIFAKAIRTMHFDSPITNRVPIPKIDSKNKKLTDKLIALVDEILESKAKDSETDTIKLESEIDSLVYELYNLSQEEISIIEGR